MRITPLRLITLHLSHIGFTLDLTFMAVLLSRVRFATQLINYTTEIMLFQGFLLVSPDDPPFGQIIGGELHRDLVSREDADEVLP